MSGSMCERSITKKQYKKITDEITRFLNGGYKEIKKELTEKMTEASEELGF